MLNVARAEVSGAVIGHVGVAREAPPVVEVTAAVAITKVSIVGAIIFFISVLPRQDR
jgi:hypothetical protein